MERQMKRRIYRAFTGILAFLPVFALSGCSSEETIVEITRAETKNIDPWAYLVDTSISKNGTMQAFAGSAAKLLITIGIMGIVFSILHLIIRLLFGGGNAKMKSEAKDEVIFKSVIAVMLFSIPFWLGIIKMISDLLV